MLYAYGYNKVEPMTRTQLQETAPSVFAESPHQSRSTRYTYIPTIQMVDALEEEGWLVSQATQQKVRNEDREGFQKHQIRLRHTDDFTRPAVVGGSVVEIVLGNSFDGSSSTTLDYGPFRFVCSNGMVVPGNLTSQKIRHTGDAINNVIEGVYEILDETPRVRNAIEEWSHIQLSEPEQLAFCEAAAPLRLSGPQSNAIAPSQFNRARRSDDTSPDLWTTFNRVQENILKGGQTGWSRSEKTGRPRRTTTRQVKGIDQSTTLNKSLWTLAEKMAELKTA